MLRTGLMPRKIEMMRIFVVVFILLVAPSPLMAEVVISNLGQASALGADFGDGDWVRFDSTRVTGMNSLALMLRAFNPGQSLTSISVTISASNAAGGGAVNRNGVINQVSGTNYFQVDFDVSGLTVGNGTNQFNFTNVLAVTSDGSGIYWGATSGNFTYASGFSGGATSDDVVGTYGQFAVSVPEPGTWRLGSVLALIVITGWKGNRLVAAAIGSMNG